MLRLQTIQAMDRELLRNINQKYLYEMNKSEFELYNGRVYNISGISEETFCA